MLVIPPYMRGDGRKRAEAAALADPVGLDGNAK